MTGFSRLIILMFAPKPTANRRRLPLTLPPPKRVYFCQTEALRRNAPQFQNRNCHNNISACLVETLQFSMNFQSIHKVHMLWIRCPLNKKKRRLKQQMSYKKNALAQKYKSSALGTFPESLESLCRAKLPKTGVVILTGLPVAKQQPTPTTLHAPGLKKQFVSENTCFWNRMPSIWTSWNIDECTYVIVMRIFGANQQKLLVHEQRL